MGTVIANPTFIVNNITVAVKPNSVVFDEGFGEQILRAASSGGGAVEQILADDITDNFSNIKVALDPTPTNIAIARVWKAQPGQNGIAITGSVVEGARTVTFRRIFNNASLTNNYEVPLGADTSIDLEFKSDPAQ